MQFTTGEYRKPGGGNLEVFVNFKDAESILSSRRSEVVVPINDGHQWASRPNTCLRKGELSVEGSGLTRHLLTFAQHQSRKIFTDPIEKNEPVMQLKMRDRIDRVMKLLEKKIVCGFRGIEEIFKAGNYQLSRQKFEKLLFALVGLLSKEECEEVLKRLNLHTKENVTFDDFMSKFRLNETVKRLWNNEAQRKQLDEDAAKTFADKITDADCISRKRWRLQGTSSPKLQLMSAAQVVTLLRKMVKESPQKVRNFFKNVQDSESAMIVKDQMSRIVSELGIVMFMEEFTKLWNRFDFARTGQIPLDQFYRSIGLMERAHMDKGKKGTGTSRKSPNILEITSQATEEDANALTESPYDFDLKMFLTSKFNEGRRSVLNAWKKTFSGSKEKMTRHEFRYFLEQFRIYLTPRETESFLLRYRMKEETFDFPLFLAIFFNLSKAKIADKCSAARLPRGFSPRGGLSTIQRADDMLIDVIHRNYIAISKELWCIEASNGGFVMVQDFVNLLKRLFNLQLNVPSIRRSLSKYNFVKDMVVDWPKLLEACSGIRSGKIITIASLRGSSGDSLRRSTSQDVTEKEHNRHILEDVFMASPKLTPQKLRSRSAPNNRSLVSSIGKVMRDLTAICTTKSKEVKRLAEEFQYHKSGCLTKESFLTLFNNRCGLSLTSSELESIWCSLPSFLKLDKNYVDVHQLVQYFATLDLAEGPGELKKIPSQVSLDKVRDDKIAFLEESTQDQGPVKRKNVTEIKDLPPSLISFGKQLTDNWHDVELKLQDLDEEASGLLGLDDIKVIADMMHTELSCEAVQFIQKEFASSTNPDLIDYISLFQVIKSKGNQTSDRRRSLSEQSEESGLISISPFDFAVGRIRRKYRKNWRQLRRQCVRADMNNDGCLSHSDFVQTLRTFKFHVTKDEYYYLSSFFDENLDGQMPYKRFFSHVFGDP